MKTRPAILVFLACCAAGCDLDILDLPEQSHAPDPKALVHVEGTLTLAGQPLQGVEVTLWAEHPSCFGLCGGVTNVSAWSNAQGHYVFDAIIDASDCNTLGVNFWAPCADGVPKAEDFYVSYPLNRCGEHKVDHDFRPRIQIAIP